ncbi:hypothetical protein M0804_008930 [Polistes exclamans]|nr:hypothetical protein M0804_008930 [Polistes exclamans]
MVVMVVVIVVVVVVVETDGLGSSNGSDGGGYGGSKCGALLNLTSRCPDSLCDKPVVMEYHYHQLLY